MVSPRLGPTGRGEVSDSSLLADSDQRDGWEISTSRRQKRASSMEKKQDTVYPKQGFLPVAGVNRPRSPPSCNKCLRSSHTTAECRHLLTCKRCGGAGHLATNCRVKLPSPPRRRRVRPGAHESRQGLDETGTKNVLAQPSRPRWQRSHLSISLSQETSKLRRELSKIIVLDIVSGQTNEDILREFLPGALNTPRVEAVYEFKDNSYLATLVSEEEAIKASRIGELSLPSKLGPCVFTIKHWSADIGSVGSASGRSQVLLIWNLPLHAWTWSVLVELLRPIGELVTIPQPSKPHKAFLSVLVCCRHNVVLPHEVVLSFGMRKFIVLITNNRLPFPSFQRDLDKYVYKASDVEAFAS